MGLDSRESDMPIFEVDGYPVFDFNVTNVDNMILFSFMIKSEDQPTIITPNQNKLIDSVCGWKLLKDKKWIDDQRCALVQFNQSWRIFTKNDGINHKISLAFMKKDSVNNLPS